MSHWQYVTCSSCSARTERRTATYIAGRCFCPHCIEDEADREANEPESEDVRRAAGEDRPISSHLRRVRFTPIWPPWT